VVFLCDTIVACASALSLKNVNHTLLRSPRGHVMHASGRNRISFRASTIGVWIGDIKLKKLGRHGLTGS
jgi:hypothetical protein